MSKCAVHPERESVAYCGECGRAMCAECRHEVRGVSYCENCLAAHMRPGVFYRPSDLGSQPGVALFLGFIPGVGAIYNGQFLKAIIQVLIFGSLVAFSGRIGGPLGTVFGLGAAAFYFYMVIDSYQTARRKQLGEPAEDWPGFSDMKMNAPIGAIILIVIGSIFLLDNLGVHVFAEIGRFWPLLLIAIGVAMLQRGVRRRERNITAAARSAESSQGGGESPPDGEGPQNKEL